MQREGRAYAETHAEARIKPIVAAGGSTTLRVVLTAPAASSSEHAPTDAAGPAAAGSRQLLLTVTPRGLKTAIGVRRRRPLRVTAGGSATATFRLVGVERGPGEVVVEICDASGPLTTLALTVEVVAADDHDQAGVARVHASVPERATIDAVAEAAAEPPATTVAERTVALLRVLTPGGSGSTA